MLAWPSSAEAIYKKEALNNIISFISAPISVDITCDNSLWFYADGVAFVDETTPESGNWLATKHVVVPGGTKVLGIKCHDAGFLAGIIASFSDGMVTDASWK